MALEISDDVFYLVKLEDSKTVHDNQDEAISKLQNEAKDTDLDAENVSVVKVAVEGEDWTIAEMSWQSIALKLMGGE